MTASEGAPAYVAYRRARALAASVAHATLGRLALAGVRTLAGGIGPRHEASLPERPDAVLVVCPGKIGDTVATEPAIRLLRNAYPRARLEALGRRDPVGGPIRGGAEVLPLVPGLDGVHTYARLGELPALAGRWDLVIVLGLEAHAAWAGLLARGRRGAVLGYDWAGRGAALDLAVEPPPQVMLTARQAFARRALPQHRFWCELLARAGIVTEPVAARARPPKLAPRPRDHDDARAIVHERGLPTGRLVAFSPWNAQAHFRWPEPRWIELGRAVLKEALAHGLVVLGGDARAERESVARIAAGIGQGAAPLAGVIGIDRTAALMSSCTAVVSIDSGPAHVARAVAAPTVVVTGPGSPAVWAPPGALIAQRADGCFGCRQPRCSVAGHECLDDLPVAVVLQATRLAARSLPMTDAGRLKTLSGRLPVLEQT